MSKDSLEITPYELQLPALVYPVQEVDDRSRKNTDADARSIITVTCDPGGLPPLDEGYRAWTYVVALFFLEAIIWGLPFSYGVFLDYYSTIAFPSQSDQALLPLIGTLSSGIMSISGVVVIPAAERYPRWRSEVQIIGLILCMTSFLGAAFATRPIHLVLTQGVMFSLGGAVLYFPAVKLLPQWFDRRLGLASGIYNSGAGIGGVVMPFIVHHLLYGYGLMITMLILGMITCGMVLPMTLFCKPRIETSQPATLIWVDTVFLRRGVFWLFAASSFIRALGSCLPGMYIPLFADHLGLGTTAGTLAIALLDGLSVPGIIAIGAMSDHCDLRWTILLTNAGSAATVFLIWGFSKNLVVLVLFASCFGFLNAGYSAIIPKNVACILHNEPHLYGTVISFMAFSRGLGNILAAPISSAIMANSSTPSLPEIGYKQHGFSTLIYFTGATMLLSNIAVFYPQVTRRRINPMPRTSDEEIGDAESIKSYDEKD